MPHKKKKLEKPLKINMGLDEALKYIAQHPKDKTKAKTTKA